MKNASRNISIYQIEGNLKNPQTKEDMDSITVALTFSKNRVARVWFGYSDICIGVAGGYGYDKESVALGEALFNLTELQELYNNGSGFETLKEQAKKYGIIINKIW